MNKELETIYQEMEIIQEDLHKLQTVGSSPAPTSFSIYRPVTESDRSAIRSVVPGTPPSTKTLATGGSTFTPEVELYSVFIITAQDAALTIANPTNTSYETQKILIRIKDNATPRALTFGSEYRATTVALPTTTTTSKALYMGFMRNAQDSKWDIIASVVVA